MKKSENIGLQKLKDAFKEINSEELNNLNIPKEDFEFSERYKKNMEKLLAKQRKPYFRYFNTAGKRAVACILIVAMLFASSMTIEAVREPVVEFFVSVYEKFVEIFFGDDEIENSPDAIEEIYTLGYVLEGYEFVGRENNSIYSKSIWENGKYEIIFYQYILSGNETLDFQNSSYNVIKILNFNVSVIEKNDKRILYWNNNEYSFRLYIPNYFSNEDITNIIKNVTY
ncbi:MAG: hypothetical protein IJW76_00280 [Clostridia bacterium]|nr:hypothetical protein [Clostridia bacterium]